VTTATLTRPIVVHRLRELERPAQLAIELEEARRRYPTGTKVTYWPGYNQHVGQKSVTRSEVWRMPAGQLVVKIDGRAGGIALTHITQRFRDTERRDEFYADMV
jgi:hypothetical protein